MRFTFAYLSHRQEVFDRYLGPSLELIESQVDVFTRANLMPARFYNEAMKASANRYIIFSHEDVSFSTSMLSQVEASIRLNPSFGVLGVAGRNENNEIVGATASHSIAYSFCDPCFFVIDTENDLAFDEITFDDYHFASEDYCVTVREKLKKNVAGLLLNWGKESPYPHHFKHYSYTCKTVKYQWGKYQEYKNRFRQKWNALENIRSF